ncbi:protein kinase [Belnapia sp. T6]|uniref:Protein kinase n=1 Tax=Belnapia mucosa TaxID=2804532 RepID=A0ABS1VD38_9PROT|nr:serine/threonine-protein kinase [Belnapia mucosa]MBL6458644.1 protein kinase [Belnapia mucosa]
MRSSEDAQELPIRAGAGAPPASHALLPACLPPEVERRYEIGQRLGEGAAGVVYDALDRNLGRRVAIKLVRRPLGGGPSPDSAFGRLRVEAQAVGRLSHPHIVAVFDRGESSEAAWIIMELVDGESLEALLDRDAWFPLAEAARIMEQLLSALAHSHAQGVVHRDVKPANIMLARDRQVKLVDFGVAQAGGCPAGTLTGTVLGTPSHMAPEQVRGEPTDYRADIWAAGVVLYRLLTRAKPFAGDLSAVTYRILHLDPPAPSQVRGAAVAAFDPVLGTALAKRPEDRYQSAASFAAAIREAASLATAASGATTASPPTGTMASHAPGPHRRNGEGPRGMQRCLPRGGRAGRWLKAATAAAVGASLLGGDPRDRPHHPSPPTERDDGRALPQVLLQPREPVLPPSGGEPPQPPFRPPIERSAAATTPPTPSGATGTAAVTAAGHAPTWEVPPEAQKVRPGTEAKPDPRPALLQQGRQVTIWSGANLRADPRARAAVLRTIHPRTQLRLFAGSGEWLQVGELEPWGWVHESRVRRTPRPPPAPPPPMMDAAAADAVPDAETLVQHGDAMLALGDLGAARAFYERAGFVFGHGAGAAGGPSQSRWPSAQAEPDAVRARPGGGAEAASPRRSLGRSRDEQADDVLPVHSSEAHPPLRAGPWRAQAGAANPPM